MGTIAVLSALLVLTICVVFAALPMVIMKSMIYKEKSAQPKIVLLSDQRIKSLEHDLLGDLYEKGSMHSENCYICAEARKPVVKATEEEKDIFQYYLDETNRKLKDMGRVLDDYKPEFYGQAEYDFWKKRDEAKTKEIVLAGQRKARYQKYKKLYGAKTAQHMIDEE